MAEITKVTKVSAPKKAATKATKPGSVDAKVKKAEPRKPVAKKADSAAKPVVKNVPSRKPSESKAPVDKKTVSDEQRFLMIAEAAYFRAESRNFQSDHVRDWIEAERDIALLLGEKG